MSKIPPQIRALDPYSGFDSSSSVNMLTRAVTNSVNGISNSYPIDVIIESGTTVILKQGMLFKDDVITQLSGDFLVDFLDDSFYRTPSFNEAGYYYILAEYGYEKIRPANTTSILILKPTERGAFNYDQHVMLKIAHVSYVGSNFIIDGLFDYDPENITNKVIWTRSYPGKEAYLPVFDTNHDIGKITIDRKSGIFYVGTIEGWQELGVFDSPCDTSLCQRGAAVYIDAANVAHPAIATSIDTLAFGFVIRVADDMSGVVRFSGRFTNGLLESGVTPVFGEFLYLSDAEAGRVTNVPPNGISSYAQPIGKCMDSTGSYFDTILTYLGTTVKTIPHNNLISIQGGINSERYHLTAADYNHVVNQDFTHNNLTSKDGGDGTHYYHLSEVTFSNIGDGSHNSLAGLQGGDSTDMYHLTASDYNHVINQDFDHANLSNVLGGGEYHLSYTQYIGFTAFEPGTKTFFVQASAPLGWTQVTSVNDRVIRVVNGTDSTGGATGGSWNITGLSSPPHLHTMPHTHIIDGHTHGVNQDAPNYGGGDQLFITRVTGVNATQLTTNSQNTNESQVTTALINSDGMWRPSYLDIILAQKD